MNTQKWLAAGLISLSALAVGVVPAQASTAGSSQTKEAYVKQLKPGVKAYARASPTTTFTPRASARVRTTAIVCGWQSAATKNVSLPGRPLAA